MLFLLVGMFVGVYWGYVCAQRLAPFSRPTYTTSVRGWGDPFYGGSYIAIVEGREIECTGGDQPFSTDDRVLVVYERDSPGRCRKADKVGRLSIWEWRSLLADVVFVSLGVFLLTVREHEHSRARRVLSRTCLLVAAVVLAVTTYLVVAVTGV